ncbi:DUF998 domain-containing protein [Enterococcus sp. BWB1-3]|uniref:DUF998 domain-containing protein n=1 Tax=Enterococcus sp. BWB1-3 TaxID=2787713 RepID=UPI001923FB9B|nr:DUF998 domain-containing protein [Enterococcus sp. BWB1-3]MBL1229717.1 DUF998 domain-containing protein [Enterococcus sp. BWB1-3]
MDFLKRNGFYFLMLGAVSDFLTPYILGLFFPAMNQLTMVISVFGDVSSPVRQPFLIWSVVSGIFFVLALPALYQEFVDISRTLTILLVSAIGFYGVGDCIFTGLFSINMEQAGWNLSTWIHNIGSGLGYTGFLLFPFLLFLLYKKQLKKALSHFYLFSLFVSILFAGIYGLARIPKVSQFPFLNQIGLCQHVSFFFNYLPIVVFSFMQIRQSRRPSGKFS